MIEFLLIYKQDQIYRAVLCMPDGVNWLGLGNESRLN